MAQVAKIFLAALSLLAIAHAEGDFVTRYHPRRHGGHKLWAEQSRPAGRHEVAVQQLYADTPSAGTAALQRQTQSDTTTYARDESYSDDSDEDQSSQAILAGSHSFQYERVHQEPTDFSPNDTHDSSSPAAADRNSPSKHRSTVGSLPINGIDSYRSTSAHPDEADCNEGEDKGCASYKQQTRVQRHFEEGLRNTVRAPPAADTANLDRHPCQGYGWVPHRQHRNHNVESITPVKLDLKLLVDGVVGFAEAARELAANVVLRVPLVGDEAELSAGEAILTGVITSLDDEGSFSTNTLMTVQFNKGDHAGSQLVAGGHLSWNNTRAEIDSTDNMLVILGGSGSLEGASGTMVLHARRATTEEHPNFMAFDMTLPPDALQDNAAAFYSALGQTSIAADINRRAALEASSMQAYQGDRVGDRVTSMQAYATEHSMMTDSEAADADSSAFGRLNKLPSWDDRHLEAANEDAEP